MEKLKLAYELKKEGKSLREISKATGIDYRHLSVLFKYIKSLDGIEINNISEQIKQIAFDENNKLKEEIKKLQELVKRLEKEKKNLAINLQTHKINLKVVNPLTLASLLIATTLIGLAIGATSATPIVKSFFDINKKLETLTIKQKELETEKAKLQSLKNEIVLQRQQLAKELKLKEKEIEKYYARQDKILNYFFENSIDADVQNNKLILIPASSTFNIKITKPNFSKKFKEIDILTIEVNK